MRGFTILGKRWRSLTGRQGMEQELDEELRYHLQRQMEEDVAAGMSLEEARAAALRSMDGLEQKKEECRDMRGLNVIDNLRQDGQFALRQLRKNPGFTATAVLMLGLGMCASVAIFAFVDAALLQPLPYRDPGTLAAVYESVEMFPRSNLSYPDYLDWKRMNTVFARFDAYRPTGFLLSLPSGPQASRGARVTDGFFQTLGVKPILGRDFYKGEDLAGAARTVLLSYAAWTDRYGGRPDAIGKTVTLNGQLHVIIGVLPRAFHFAPVEPAHFWTAFHAESECDLRRSCHGMFGVGRLKDGATLGMAQLDLKQIASQLEREYPASNIHQGAAVTSLSEAMVGDIRPILLVLLSGAGLLLLIAAVNVTSLLLVRSESRKREIAVRRALGASASRVMRQFVTEGLVLVGAGGTIGVLSAYWVMKLLTRLIPADMLAHLPFLQGLGLRWHVLVFALAVAVAAALLFSLAPARHVNSPRLREGLAEGSRGSAGLTWSRLGAKLVVVELATAMVLLVGAGLLGKSFYRLLAVDLGLRPDHLATLEIGAPAAMYPTNQRSAALEGEIRGDLENLPGVKGVTVTNMLPVTNNGNTDWIRFVGKPFHGEHNEVNQREVGDTYFATIGATMLRGRAFAETDDLTRPRVTIINEALAKQYYPGEDPIGKKIADDALTPDSIREVVGVVRDMRDGALDARIWPAEYLPFRQSPETSFAVIVRTGQEEHALTQTLAGAIRRSHPGLLVEPGPTLGEVIQNSSTAYVHRSSAWLVGGFAGIALLLSVVGLYGVVAYSVGQRTREIGVRIALGARQGTVYRLILREAGVLCGVGIAIGVACSLGATALIRGMLFRVRPWDGETLCGVALLLGTAALAASFLPARRAATINPVEALRTE